MNTPLVRLLLIGLLLLMVVAPFAALAPLTLVLLGFGVCWFIGSLVQAFLTADVEREDEEGSFRSSQGKS